MSKKIIVVAGFGPGISNAVAERFGKEGFAVALIARNEERLTAGAKALRDKGIEATAFRADLSDPGAVRATFDKIRQSVGPISIVHWNLYGVGAGDLTTSPDAELRGALDAATTNLVAAVQTALPDLRSQKESAILVTNGAFGLLSPESNAMCVQYNAMGLGVANAAKHKLVALLAEKLKTDGIHVAEVIVAGTVRGTAWDQGQATLDAKDIAERFWSLFKERSTHSAIFPGA
jgi:short-subunit dehydrogenase